MGKKLEEAIKRSGMKTDEFAEAVGVTSHFIRYLIRGVKRPSVTTLKLMADLQLFANVETATNTLASLQPTYLNTNTTGDGGLSVENKTFYDKVLIQEAGPALVHDQFAQKRNIPKNGGKTIEFRKFMPLEKALTPLVEGLTPSGNRLNATNITATVDQYGDIIVQSDLLELTAIDNTIVEATKLLGKQAGLTLDTITRNAMQMTRNASFADRYVSTVATAVKARADLDITAKITVDDILRVVTKLRAQNAPTINGKYVGIIHPYAAYDLMRDPEFIEWHKYAQPGELYAGEIGEIGGVRFVESTEAKIYRPQITSGSATLTVKTNTSSSTSCEVKEVITAEDVAAYAARNADDKYLYIGGTKTAVSALVAGNDGSASSITLGSAASLTADTVIADFKDQGTKTGVAVFGTLIFGADAYATTEVTGGGLETIVKQKGSGGTSDPLNQRSSVGWKALKVSELLVENYIVRLESVSPRYSNIAKAN
ncbi:MAG: N4-gp56 family major capsid protein [Clostridia bacterium]|nr:N4-gp56 family major capsid protein [Clostridia bacterium]